MMSIQSQLRFPMRKKSSFYGSKENTPKEDFTNTTLRPVANATYTPTVKKIVTFSSSSESDSDEDMENVIRGNNFNCKPKKRVEQANVPRRTKKSSHVGDKHTAVSEKNLNCSPRKRVDPPSTPKQSRKSDDEEERGSTPPKQRKSTKALSPTTPSSLLDRLKLEGSPESDTKWKPKRLFASGKYQSARKALHSSIPTSLPGRESELTELRSFLLDHKKNECSGSLYVSGPPGTGKTACLSSIIAEKEFRSAFKTIYVNCTAIKSAGTIYSKIIEELGLECPNASKNGKATIERFLPKSDKMILLILDEIDQLESKRQSVLYSIFEWPSKPSSRLILIGIANALDLTDRILPRLQARCELKPKLMHFAPYDKRQIADIITERLSGANVADVFTGTAVQMLAGKVAAVSGDVRRALDISRRVVELAETEKMTQILKPTVDNESNGGNGKQQQTLSEKAVDLKQVVQVLNGVYGGSQNMDKEETTFPLQQKVLLCSLMLILNKGRNKDITISKVHEVYKRVCRKRNIHAVDISEFVGLCSLIETRGVLKLTSKKEPRLSKVNLQYDQEELESALQDRQMMFDIMNDETCL